MDLIALPQFSIIWSATFLVEKRENRNPQKIDVFSFNKNGLRKILVDLELGKSRKRLKKKCEKSRDSAYFLLRGFASIVRMDII